MPQKKSIKTFDHGAHVPETVSGLSMSASHTKCEGQIFVEGMKDGMYKHPGCQTDFVPFLSLTAPGTSSASAQCLLHTTRIHPQTSHSCVACPGCTRSIQQSARSLVAVSLVVHRGPSGSIACRLHFLLMLGHNTHGLNPPLRSQGQVSVLALMLGYV